MIKKSYQSKIVAEQLNEHFSKKGFKLASNLPNATIPLSDSLGRENPESINFTNIEKSEVENLINSDIKTSVLIKWGATVLSPILAKLFQSFVEIGVYPTAFKVAKVTAIHKGGSVFDTGQYQYCHP